MRPVLSRLLPMTVRCESMLVHGSGWTGNQARLQPTLHNHDKFLPDIVFIRHPQEIPVSVVGRQD